MKILINTFYQGADAPHGLNVGQVYNVEEELAMQLIENRKAVAVIEEQPEPVTETEEAAPKQKAKARKR